MGFFGGFLKFLSILVIIGATVLCTNISVNGSELEVYLVMGAVALFFGCFALSLWGAGTALGQISKMKKKLEFLEQRLYREPVKSAALEDTAFSIREPRDPHGPRYARQKEASSRVWILVLVMAFVMVAAMGVGAAILLNLAPEEETAIAPAPSQTVPMLAVPAATEAPEPEEAAPAGIQEALDMGQSVVTDFVEIHFQDYVIAENVQNSVTIGNVTRTTGPQPLEGQQYLCLTGTIVNTSSAPLPVYDFFTGEFRINDYTYTVSANDCDILEKDGSTVSEIDPLMEYDMRIYVAIPDALADHVETCTFAFGFYEGFDNHELSYNKAFSDDPISLCPYQFRVTLA